MIGWKFKCWERHIFNVHLFSGVVLPGLRNFEVILSKKDEIFRVHVAIGTFVRLLTGLIQLRLQIRPRIEGGVV